MQKTSFGTLPDGRTATLYSISGGGISAQISDLGATIVRLFVPDRKGVLEDVALGYADPEAYLNNTTMGSIVGRNANRIKGAEFVLNGKTYTLEANDHGNSLHSGLSPYKKRLWTLEAWEEDRICLSLVSPDGDQGFPGNLTVRVTYSLRPDGSLVIAYDALSDKDTVFNPTNHCYFNLAGHNHPEKAMAQELSMPARVFCPADDTSVPTGELRDVAGTPMDFRIPKPLNRDLEADYQPLHQAGGYDHNYEVFANPCAVLRDPDSGRCMAMSTDFPGLQLYTGNYLSGEAGKDGAHYPARAGVCLEAQFYPDAIHKKEWKQPILKADQPFHGEVCYRFFCD